METFYNLVKYFKKKKEKWWDDDNGEPKKNPPHARMPCSVQRKAFIDCILESECIRNGKDFKECIKCGDDVSSECQTLRTNYFECRRSMLDMRYSYRGKSRY
eukprot:GEZU01010658.1.p1 GENE.GEZU01010658.1~~GEZU01010658.1.p1  ORF type:complete len:116 (+),score=5.88 GEZU01010658.1:44-349(+)